MVERPGWSGQVPACPGKFGLQQVSGSTGRVIWGSWDLVGSYSYMVWHHEVRSTHRPFGGSPACTDPVAPAVIARKMPNRSKPRARRAGP
jgi:hypothetical protein